MNGEEGSEHHKPRAVSMRRTGKVLVEEDRGQEMVKIRMSLATKQKVGLGSRQLWL